MGSDWARLGAKLKAARTAMRQHQEAMAEKVGVRRSALQNIEAGNIKKVTPTIQTYARVVGWTPDSVEAVLAGGDPTPTGRAGEADPDAVADGTQHTDLPLKVVHSLAEGPLLDATVLHLPTGSADARMTVVVRGRPDATPEEIRQALEAWERTQRHLQDLDGDEDDTAGPTASEA